VREGTRFTGVSHHGPAGTSRAAKAVDIKRDFTCGGAVKHLRRQFLHLAAGAGALAVISAIPIAHIDRSAWAQTQAMQQAAIVA
jgi:hypothetical protein